MTPLPPLPALERAAVVLDRRETSWGVYLPDAVTMRALVHELPRLEDDLLRAAVWNNVRSGFHQARVAPDSVVDLLEVAFPVEDTEDTGRHTVPWVLGSVLPAASGGARERVHTAALGLVASSAAGSERQLSAFRATVHTATEPAMLRGWLARSPDGIDLDLDLRWRLLNRLAAVGATDRDELDRELAAEATGTTRVAHTLAVASLPTAEAKAFAWERFTGEVDVPNYEIEAAGTGLWRSGHDDVARPYVERYFTDLPATSQVRSGWLLALATEAFFPVAVVEEDTLAQARTLLDSGVLEPSVRRRVVDSVDELERRLAVRRTFPTS